MTLAAFLYSSGTIIENKNHLVNNLLQSGGNDCININAGGTVIGTTILAGGSQFVFAGGSASATVISSGGGLHVSSGAKIKDTIVNQSGFLGIGDGAIASITHVRDVGELTVWGGGYVEANTIDTWGAILLSSGAKAYSTTVNAQGGLHVYSGAVASNTTVNQGGVMGVGLGATIYETTIGSANLTIYGGGVAHSNTINRQGNIILSSGALTVDTVINSKGGLHVYAGAVASNTTVKQDGFFGVGYGATVYNTSIGYAGALTVWGGGLVEVNTIDTWGAIILSSGAVANSTTILANGGLHIYDGATAFTTTVEEGATLGIGSGGTVHNLKGNYGASLVFYEGAFLRGEGNFAGSVTVNGLLDAAGSSICFTLDDRSSSDDAILNDITLVQGASYSVKISDFLQEGSYKLAGNAGSFTGGITIVDTTSNLQTSLQLNSSVQLGNHTFNLSTVNDILTLTVGANEQFTGYQLYTVAGTKTGEGSTANALSIGTGCAGQILLVSNGQLTNTNILAGGAAIGAKNAVLSTVQINQGTLQVRTGAKANNVTVDSFGYLIVEKNGGATNVILNKEGRLSIESGGTVTDITDGGHLGIGSGGSAVRVNQLSGTYLNVLSKGTLRDAVIQGGAATVVHGKGKGEEILVSSGGILRLYESGFVNNVEVLKGGTLEMDYGASAAGVVLDSNAAGLTVNIDKNTILTGTSAGSAFAVSNGVLSGFDWKASTFALSSCTELFFFLGEGAQAVSNTFSAGHIQVSSGGVSYANDMHYYAQLNVYSGGTASGNILDSEAEMYVMGGSAADTIINSGGYAWISSEGIASNTIINFSGHLNIGSEWVLDHETEIQGGKGGSAYNTTVNRGGFFEILSGTSASMTTVHAGGNMIIDASISDDILLTGPGAGLHLHYGGSAKDVTVKSGGAICVYRNGFLTDLDLQNGLLTVTGDIMPITPGKNYEKFVSSSIIYQTPGSASNLTLHKNATVNILSGATVTSVVNSGGAIALGQTKGGTLKQYEMTSGNLTVYSGALLEDAGIKGGYVTIYSGGKGKNIKVTGGSFQIKTGAAVENLSIDSSAYIDLTLNDKTLLAGNVSGRAFQTKNGVLENYTNLTGCLLKLENKGKVSGTIVENGGYIYISSGAQASNTVIKENGVLTVYSGGLAKGGSCYGHAYINGGSLQDMTIQTGAYAHISSGATGNQLTISSGAGIYCYSGGRLTDLTLTAGAAGMITNGTTDKLNMQGGYLTLSGGTLKGAVIHSGAILAGSQAVTLQDTEIKSGGTLSLAATCRHEGNITLAEGASFQANGASINISLAGKNTGAGAVIVNQRYLYDGDYSITVSSNQAAGTYAIATNSYIVTFTSEMDLFIENQSSSIGEISLFQSVTYNGKTYSLSSDTDNNIYLHVNPISYGIASQQESANGDYCGGNEELFDAGMEKDLLCLPAGEETSDIAFDAGNDPLLLTGSETIPLAGAVSSLTGENTYKDTALLLIA